MADSDSDNSIINLVNTVTAEKFTEYSKQLDSKFSDFADELRSTIGDEISSSINQLLGDNNLIGNALGAGVGNSLAMLLSGRGVNARSVANSAALAVAPMVGDLIGRSSSQLGEQLMDFINTAERNL